MTLSITTLRVLAMLNVLMLSFILGECRYTKCYYDECRGTVSRVVLLNQINL